MTSKARLQSLAYTSSPMTFYGLPLDYSLSTRFSFLHCLMLLIDVNTVWLIDELGNDFVSAEGVTKHWMWWEDHCWWKVEMGPTVVFIWKYLSTRVVGLRKPSIRPDRWYPVWVCDLYLQNINEAALLLQCFAVLCNAVVLWNVVGLQFTVCSNSSLHHTRLGCHLQFKHTSNVKQL